MDQVTLWRAKIRLLRNNSWVMLGVDSCFNENDSYASSSTYGWACHGQVYKPYDEDGYGGWTTFLQGDEVVMMLNPKAATLSMVVPRLGRTFRLDLPHEPEWYFYINLHGGGDSVELLPASPEDAKLFV